MKQYNIAQIGAFDYENLGDILFTDVLHRQLEKRIPIGKHMLFALNEVKKPLSESDSTVYGIDRLEEMHLAVHFDAVIIGGGDLIRFDSAVAPEDNYSSHNTTFDLIFSPVMVCAKYNIPLIWNAPGVPLEFTAQQGKIIDASLAHVDLAAVRDNPSMERIKPYSNHPVEVCPDTVLSMSEVIDLTEYSEKVKAQFPVLNGEYVVFQSFPSHQSTCSTYHSDLVSGLREVLKKHKLVLLTIGRIHHDDVFLNALEKELDSENVTVIDIDNTFEISAVLQGASAFIGTSLHGNIISNSYGVPSIILDVIGFIKTKGYFELMGRNDYVVSDASIMGDVLEKMLEDKKLERLPDLKAQVNTHFDRIASLITEGKTKSSPLLPFLRAVYSPEKELNFFLRFLADGELMTTKVAQDNDAQVDMILTPPASSKVITVSPCENSICLLRDVKITADGKEIKYKTSGIKTNGDIFFCSPVQDLKFKSASQVHISFRVLFLPRNEQYNELYHQVLLSTNGIKRNLKTFIYFIKSKLKR